LGAGIRTAFIADLDVREQLGNHIFLDSGLLRTFDQLEHDEIGVPNTTWIEDYFFDTDGLTPAEQIADRAVELAESDRDRPQAWQTALFASQHELITYRRQLAADRPVVGDRAAVLRAVARWVLPHGIHSQLRQVRARRSAGRQADHGKQTAGPRQTRAERLPSRIG
jgi:hypothetical protein